MFKDIKKLTSMNWGQVGKTLVPNGSQITLTADDAKTITKGSIIRIVGAAISQAMVILAAYILVFTVASSVFGSKLTGAALGEVAKENLGKWIVQLVAAEIVPICVLIYALVMKNKAQNGWPMFIFLIIVVAQAAYAIYDGLTNTFAAGIGALAINGLFGLIIIAGSIVGLICIALGTASIALGCVEFLQKQGAAAPAAPNAATPNAAAPANQLGGYQPTAAPMTPVTPVAPAAPAPAAPVEPAIGSYQPTPVAPIEPVAPAAPVEPMTPVTPVAPAAPAPAAPTEPVAPVAPAAPAEPVFDPTQTNQF